MNLNKALMNSDRGHKLMTKEIEKRIPALYSTDGKGELGDRIVHVKYFTPASNWTWYALEYDPVERIFFGYVQGFEGEFGNFSLDELESLGGAINRECYDSPKPLKEYVKDI